jgi:hypothetical protein
LEDFDNDAAAAFGGFHARCWAPSGGLDAPVAMIVAVEGWVGEGESKSF